MILYILELKCSQRWLTLKALLLFRMDHRKEIIQIEEEADCMV